VAGSLSDPSAVAENLAGDAFLLDVLAAQEVMSFME
jgi:hypothetical protein